MDNNTIPLAKLQGKKVLGLLLAESYKRLGDISRAIRIEQCGTYLQCATLASGKNAIIAANFCRERLCPACAWRRSARIYGATSQILDYIDKHDNDHKYLFLTLTVANCPAEQLGETLNMMADGMKRMVNNRAWKRRVKGCMKTLEITINHEDNTMHPHYHLILMVPKDYGKRGDKLYWEQSAWASLWEQSARLDYSPLVWIEKVKGGRKKGLAEISKYMAKDNDYILPDNPERTDEIVQILQEQLAGRRLVSYTGELLKAQRALKIDNPEDGNLLDMDAAKLRPDMVVAIRNYHWSAGLSRYVPGDKWRWQQGDGSAVII